jgi:hypothetical protein
VLNLRLIKASPRHLRKQVRLLKNQAL